MEIKLRGGLPYISARIVYHGQTIELDDVLLDTGSAGTIFATDKLAAIGLCLELHDTIHRIRGVGGSEFAFTKHVDQLSIGNFQVQNFEVEVGAMAYGLPLDGIVGMDFLLQVGACIDLRRLEIA
ncbi:MAG TPA: retropepsin-like aspartic protease [Anaerolineae bacterium]|nr:retropepsin-like aspartic protease [Anaerolineae bacterium]